ncbi:MAG: Asp23/Gls24 family envelope stress response protein [Fretibacterium sp.]|nr:Asp23/Gls24 family envelope stress response protein [Fretibacterium sp.]
MDQAYEGKKGASAPQTKDAGLHSEGNIHISDEVLVELTRKTISSIPNIQTANVGLASKFGIGRKSGEGVRVIVEEGKIPAISVDAYILVKYGQRIPDLAWDVQEKIKGNLERYTGYTVKAVNINVQGIYTDEPAPEDLAEDAEKKQELTSEQVEDTKEES